MAPAIAAGNTVVLKPSDTTPASTVFMAEVMSEFLPAGVFNVICGDRETGRKLVEHQVPAMVSITGSVRAGIEVAKSAATELKRVHLELGGKAPVVVFDDADLENAAENMRLLDFSMPDRIAQLRQELSFKIASMTSLSNSLPIRQRPTLQLVRQPRMFYMVR